MKRSIKIKLDEFNSKAISIEQQKKVKGGIVIVDTLDG